MTYNKSLNCGCCGTYFKTWEWYVDQDQDRGYGICKSCQNDNEDSYISEIEKGFDLIYNALKGENKKKAWKMLFPEREALVTKARRDWILTYKIT